MPDATEVTVRPLGQADLDQADRIFRVAFGTFLGAPDPEHFFGDTEFIRTRWAADPGAAVGAVIDGELVGSNFATNWGSVGFFGPLTVAPAHWDRGIAHRMLDATMDIFTAWETRLAGLFTFAQSAKHVGLYQRYGFWPRFLTAVMARPVDLSAGPARASVLSDVPADARPGVMGAIVELTDQVYPGLDLSREIASVATQKLGDTVLVADAGGLQAVAVCHVGPGTEAGGGTCYVKFGAVRPGPDAADGFDLLIDACNGLARHRDASMLVAGANGGRDRAWQAMTGRGFRPQMQGVAMHRANDPGYSTSDAYVIDDWR